MTVKIKKKRKGTPRPTAGRKPILERHDWIEIGARCEYLQKEVKKIAALRKYEQLDRSKDIKEVQEHISAGQYNHEQINDAWATQEIDINNGVARTKDQIGGHAVSLTTHRVATRAEIHKIVAAEWLKKGRGRIKPSRVKWAWEKYRRLLADREDSPAESITEDELLRILTGGF